MKLFPEIISEIEHYLSLIDRLNWSSVSKKYSVLINRKKINSYISAINLTHYLEWSFSDGYPNPPKFNNSLVGPISNPPDKEYLVRDVKCFMEPEPSCWQLRILGDEMLKLYNVHIHPYWFRYKKCYRVQKIILSQDLWDTEPRILLNQNVCAVYRCRKMGILRKKIVNSLTVKALVN